MTMKTMLTFDLNFEVINVFFTFSNKNNSAYVCLKESRRQTPPQVSSFAYFPPELLGKLLTYRKSKLQIEQTYAWWA